jgi:hypothetical protein
MLCSFEETTGVISESLQTPGNPASWIGDSLP